MNRSVQISVVNSDGVEALVRVDADSSTGTIMFDGRRVSMWLSEFKTLACELQIALECVQHYGIPADTAYPVTTAAGDSIVMPLDLAAAVSIAGVMLLAG